MDPDLAVYLSRLIVIKNVLENIVGYGENANTSIYSFFMPLYWKIMGHIVLPLSVCLHKLNVKT